MRYSRPAKCRGKREAVLTTLRTIPAYATKFFFISLDGNCFDDERNFSFFSPEREATNPFSLEMKFLSSSNGKETSGKGNFKKFISSIGCESAQWVQPYWYFVSIHIPKVYREYPKFVLVNIILS